jgi:hypothetical protein
MNIPQGMHMKADLVDGVNDVWARQREVLKGIDNATVEGTIRGRCAIIG